MRLNRLDLTRFGKFTELSLTFPAPAAGGPDLHVIYGANEAGKSTLLEGWLDLLFQIPVRSGMGFLHPYATMQLGAALEIDGQVHEVLRIKKRENALLDASGAPLGEALLQGGLRGLDRAAYAAMFSLNRQTLDEGGESILASKGDLGELLFQASAGLTDLAAQLDGLRDDSEAFLNRTGRKGVLRELGEAFDDLGRQIRELDTAAAEYARLSAERDRAREAWHQAREAAEAAQAGVIETERLSAALPLLPRLDRLEAEIAGHGALPDPPEGWLAELPGLDRAEAALAVRLDAADRAVTALERELDDLMPDRPVLEAHEEIAAAERLKSAHDTAVEDLPKRQGDLDARAAAVRDSLSRLGQAGADAAALLPGAAVSGRLRALIERYSGVETAHDTAERELEDARGDLERVAQRLRRAGGMVSEAGGLGGLVQGLRRDDPLAACDRARAGLDEAEARLQLARAALSPWAGSDRDLAGLVSPDRAGLERLGREMAEAGRRIDRAEDRLAQLEQDAAQARARREAIGTAAAVTLDEAARVRTRREADWARHRAALTGETADVFEAAMRLDDQVTARLADQRAHAEKAAEADRQVAAARAQLDEARAEDEALAGRLAGIVASVSAALPADIDLGGFLAWLDKGDAARAALDRRDGAARDLAQRADAVERARSDLAAALAQAGRALPEGAGLALALEVAQALLDRTAQVRALSEAEAEAQHEVARRERALEAAEAARAAWRAGWEAACAETWMAGAPPDVAAMRAILEELDRLRDQHGHVAELTHRIATMQSNRDGFERAVRALAGRLGMAADGAVPELWRDIARRLRAAESREDRRAGLAERLATARQALAEVRDAAAIHRNRTAEFAGYFGVEGWPAARDALTRAGELARLRETRRELVGDLCARMASGTVDQARARLQGHDADALAARADSLRTESKALRTAQEEAQDSFRKADDAVDAVGGDGAVARLEERRQTLLLEMEDGARRHLRQRLGLLAVDAALRRYRDTHRSGMLERASEAFRTMSRDRYSGLAAQPDGTREVLVAMAADGGSKQADQLSEGARAQLYLALRIAGYHEFARNNGPVPFVADDIMESFDDDRAAEAFGLLAKMSETGQVIYLTHHAHLCEIAKKACPSAQIHDLGD
jgi:uncharacterized protein YhaN